MRSTTAQGEPFSHDLNNSMKMCHLAWRCMVCLLAQTQVHEVPCDGAIHGPHQQEAPEVQVHAYDGWHQPKTGECHLLTAKHHTHSTGQHASGNKRPSAVTLHVAGFNMYSVHAA